MSKTAKTPEAHENVSTVEFTKEELLEKISTLEVVDGYVLLGLGALALNGQKK